MAAPNGVVSTSVGSVLTYDASKAGAAFAGGTPFTTPTTTDRGGGGGGGGGGTTTTVGLQYQITFESAANGLSANGAGDGTPKRLRLSGTDKAALVAFLNTLTDSTFLTDPRFANPFVPTTAAPPPPPPPLGIIVAAVTIQATAYHPPTLTVAPRTVVRWTNLDNARHSAGFLTAGVGATPIFTSGTQQLTMPAAPGTYRYQCAVNGAAMSGTIIVQ